MRWLNENDSFLGETPRRLSCAGSKVAAESSNWVRVVCVRDSATDVINSTSDKVGSVCGLAELWVAEIKLCTTAIGKLALWVGFEEAPDV